MIRFAKREDIPRIMSFIDEHWKKGHILSEDMDFFLYEHNWMGRGVTFVISTDKNNEINGTLGYLPYGEKVHDIMLVMWKALHSDVPALGVMMLQFLMENENARIIASVGINPKTTIELYKFLGFTTGKMRHWYRLGSSGNYAAAQIADSRIPEPEIRQDEWRLMPFASWSDLEEHFDFESYSESSKPYKERQYIRHRYFEHPIYSYKVYGAARHGKKSSLLIVFRKQQYKASSVLRLIDCIGDWDVLPRVTSSIDQIMAEGNMEYVDLYETGLAPELLLRGGWLDVCETSNIIPDHFAPYECKNIDLYYCSQDKDIVLFKGDADQDRPNRR